MPSLHVFLLLAAIVLGVIGQLFLKRGMLRVGAVELTLVTLHLTVYKMFSNLYVLIGTAIFGFSTLLYLTAISSLDLSFAYPMVSLSYVLTAILSKHLLREKLTQMRWLSIALICVGVILISFS